MSSLHSIVPHHHKQEDVFCLPLHSSFLQLTHRHRRHISRKKVLLVTLRSSADGDRGSLQTRFAREREDPSSKFGVSWVSDGMDSWAPQKQQDKPLQTESRSSANHHASSGSSSSNSFSPNNQQRAFSLSQKLPTNFNLTRKQQTRVIDPSAASRLQNRLPAFKQAAEPDAFGASFSPVHGADAFSSCNGPSPSISGTVTQKSSSLEEGSSRNESVFTSKLEEILNKFRTREKQSSSRDELYEAGRRNGVAPSALQTDTIPNEGFQAKRSNINRLQANGDRRSARRDGQNPRSIGSASETSVKENDFNEEEIFFPTARHRRDSRRERPKGNAGGLYKTVNTSSNVVDSSTHLPWEGRSPASKIQSSIRKGSSNFAGAHATKPSQSSVFGNNGRSPNSESHDGNWSTGVKKPGETGKGSKPSFISQNNHNSDARKPVVPEFDWTDSDEEDKLDTVSDARKPVVSEIDWTGSDEEDKLDAVSSITSDDGASSSHSNKDDQPSSGSSMGVKTGNPKSTMNGEIADWHSHSYPNLPFDFQYSYSETPKAPIIRYREEPYSPFGPDTMGRPWTGRPPLKKSKKNLPEFDSFKPPPAKKGVKFVQPPGPFPEGHVPTPARSREGILGEPLTGEEIVDLVDKCRSERRQLNLGRDGLTHNMLNLIHCHWKRRVVAKIKCIGVPTVDMDNVCFHLEDKTGGKIIYRAGGSVYLFRGRNYNYKDRPEIPVMLWRPISPVYPKLIKRAPEGLTNEEADKLRLLGQKVEPLCTLAKNGVYLTLVKDVRTAFRVDDLVRINCRGLNPSDYKKIGAKLRDLVPCVLLSFDDEQILMWKGKAMVTANVDADTSRIMEAGDGSEVEAAKPSASCGVSDDESRSAMEELVVDTTGVSTGRSDCSISAGAESWDDLSTATESIDQISIPELFNDDLRFEDFRETEFLARSEVKSTSPTVLDVEDDIKSDKANPMSDYTMPNDRTFDIMPGHERESNKASYSQFNESRRFMELNSLANDQEDERVVPNTVLKLDENSTKLESSRDIGAGKEGLNDTCVVRLDALWDDAIASGIAIQLDEIDTDSDVVVKKASELDKAVPAVAEYTRKLQNKLRIRKKSTPRPDGDLRIHFANLQKAKSQKKAAKRAFRSPAVDVPDNGGLPMDELARILSIK